MTYRENDNKSRNARYNIFYKWIPYAQIPEMMKKSVVVAEDASFWIHSGIDWFEVKESLKKNVKKGDFLRGGSTITQQVAKNLYLVPEKNISRKLKEWMIAVELENKLEKSRILEIYLNIAEWGNGIFGLGAAAAFYFQKHPSDLTLSEMVRMAAVLPSPIEKRPDQMTKSVHWRSREILDRLLRFGFLSSLDHARVSAELDSLYTNTPSIK